jgi:hypothetical protein
MSTFISKSGIEIGISMSECKFLCRNRNKNRNSDFDIEISTKLGWNVDEIWMKFRFLHRYWNLNFGKLKHRNFDEIRIKFCWNFDFVENDFRGNPNSSSMEKNISLPENLKVKPLSAREGFPGNLLSNEYLTVRKRNILYTDSNSQLWRLL